MSRTSISRTLRAAGAVGVAVAVVAVAAPAAHAHVTVKPDSTTAGDFSQLTLRVPNESPTASTVEVQVTLPTAKPFADVSVLPVDGWTVHVTEAKLPAPVELDGTTITKAPSVVTWTAGKGHGIADGEYQNFAISAGPLPASGTLVLPTVQTYSDGTVVRWATPQPAGAPEPEHPAPSFTVTPATTGTGAATPVASTVESSDGSSVALGWAALAVAVLALVLAGLALARGRRDQEA